MSAHPQQSTSLSRTTAAEPVAAAITAAAGSKRRASDDAQPNATEHQHPPPSRMDATPVTDVGSSSALSSGLAAADQQTAAPAASSAAAAPSASAAVTRKKQRLDQSAAAAPAVIAPPWSRLYSDALHSIFKFASLHDLARLMSVSRRWGEAVMTMPPIAAAASLLPEAHLDGLLDSRVRRHVTALLDRASNDRPCRLPVLQLQRASVQVPWLSELVATVPAWSGDVRVVNEALPHFAKLRDLDVEVEYSMPAAAYNRIIQTIGGLNPGTMHALTLRLPVHANRVLFAPLSALTQLRLFSLGANGWSNSPPLTDAQIRDLRALTSLHQLTSPFEGQVLTSFLVRMLQPGHALQWTELASCFVPVIEPLAAVLGSLPTLTTLRVWMRCADVQFFAQLTQLTDLTLGGGAEVDPAALVWSLCHCTQLTRLRLTHVNVSSRHMEELLPSFPLLSSLELHQLPQLDSLRCFATPALAVSLKSLVLSELRGCPPSELSHLLGLRSLQSVSQCVGGLAQSLTAEDIKAAFCIPSSHFPALVSSALHS